MKVRTLIKSPVILLKAVFLFFLTYLPSPGGNWIRYHYYRRRFKSCGRHVIVDVGVIINGAEHITVGDNVHIDKYCYIYTGKITIGKVKRIPKEAFKFDAGELIIGNNVHIGLFCIIAAYGGVQVGDNCALSAGTKIYSLTNTPNDLDDPSKIIHALPYEQAYFLMSPVILDENVWVGLDCIVMPGVHIGENSFVVSKSVVTGSFRANSYIRGNPARRTRERFFVTNM